MAIEFNHIKCGPRVVRNAYASTAGQVEASADPAEVQDVADVPQAPQHHGLLAALGGGLMVALSVGGTLTAPAMAAPPAISQSVSNSNLAPLSDRQALDVLGHMPGIKNTSFASHFCLWGCTFTPQKALDRLNGNGAVDAPRPGTQQIDRFSTREQLAEVAVMRGLYPNSGVSNGIVHAFQVGHFSNNGEALSDYQAFDAVRHGQAVTDDVGGRSYTVSNPAQAQALNALEGDGQNSPLSPETTSLIKRMAEQTPGEGLYHNGSRLNAYEYLQATQAGQVVTYQFTGGPYHEPLSLRASLGDLAKVSQTVANQHAADQVRPSAAFFNREMQKLTQPLTAQVNAEVQRAQGLIDGGRADIERYTASAAQEQQAISGAQAAVDAAQAAYNQTLPGWQDASQRASDAQQQVNFLTAASATAHNQESQATGAYQISQAQLNAAQQHLQQVLNPQPSQAPADPEAARPVSSAPADPDAALSPVPARTASSAPADPDAAPVPAPARTASSAPADPDATPAIAAPADPDAGGGTASNLAIAQKAQARAAVNAAQQQVAAAYDAMRQAIANRVTADIALGQAQSRLPEVQSDFAQADAIKSQAAANLQAAQDQLNSHQAAQVRDQQAVQQAQAQVQEGRQALAQAHQLQTLAAHYLKTPDRQTLEQMAKLAVSPDLKTSLARQHLLFEAMSRPAPPAGYVEPTPLVYSEQ
ncbi:MAG: hypothetical protein ACYCW6_27840 [Candidatus Xenobia bacterium]